MYRTSIRRPLGRRALLTTTLALGALRLPDPFIVKARGEEPVKIGLVNPLTGAYAALGKNEQIGCEHAVEQLNAKGGILGRFSFSSRTPRAGTSASPCRRRPR